jgi:hypothetical protein
LQSLDEGGLGDGDGDGDGVAVTQFFRSSVPSAGLVVGNAGQEQLGTLAHPFDVCFQTPLWHDVDRLPATGV